MSFICGCKTEFTLTETQKKFQKNVYGLKRFQCDPCFDITKRHALHQVLMAKQKKQVALKKTVRRYSSR